MRIFRKSWNTFQRLCRCLTTSEHPISTASITRRQNELFNQEKQRQLDMVKRIEKITVQYVGPNDTCTLAMNKYLSTPYHVGMHFNENYLKHSAIALVNGQPWHMLQTLTEDCEVRLVTMKDDDPEEVNEAFWRSCALMTGAVLQNAFKEDVYVEPVRAQDIPISQGCFAYDINLPFKWEPSQEELTCLSRLAYELAEKRVPFERLEVRWTIANELFQENEYKKAELSSTDADRVTLFRLGDFIDISPGPLVTNTGFMTPHRFSFTCVYSVDDHLKSNNKLSRFQGVALPSEFPCHYHTWDIIEERAKTPISLDEDSKKS